MTPFYGWGSTAWRLQNHYKEAAYFLSLSFQRFLVLIWSTLEGWKAELSLKPPSGFEHRTPGLGIQHPNPAGIQHLNVFVLLNNHELNICLKLAETIFNSDIFLIEKGDSGRSPHPTRHFVTLPSKKNKPATCTPTKPPLWKNPGQHEFALEILEHETHSHIIPMLYFN